jgi:hypothetical protein
MESLIFLCFFVFLGWQVRQELNIGGIYKFAMNKVRKRRHLNVDVQKRGSVFAKCIVWESLKDSICKLGKHSNEPLEYEVKLKKHILHQESCRKLYHTWSAIEG